MVPMIYALKSEGLYLYTVQLLSIIPVYEHNRHLKLKMFLPCTSSLVLNKAADTLCY